MDMTARKNLQPLQFDKLKYDVEPDHFGMGSINASHPEHGDIGLIYWNTDPKYKHEKLGGVTNIQIDPRFQRQGLGTHLYQMAKQVDPRVQHSSTQTRAGKAWAKKIGE